MERIGYYAKNKATGNLHRYHFGITDEGDDIFFVKDMDGDDVEQDVKQYEFYSINWEWKSIQVNEYSS